jgi:hypothetical protein
MKKHKQIGYTEQESLFADIFWTDLDESVRDTISSKTWNSPSFINGYDLKDKLVEYLENETA